jgi:hypothetical protein
VKEGCCIIWRTWFDALEARPRSRDVVGGPRAAGPPSGREAYVIQCLQLVPRRLLIASKPRKRVPPESSSGVDVKMLHFFLHLYKLKDEEGEQVDHVL